MEPHQQQQQQPWMALQSHQAQHSASSWSSSHSQSYHQPTSVEEIRTLWIGDLQYWVDENYLHTCFSHTGEVISIKIIRNKITGQPEGYGFVEFVSHAAAERILQTYNGTPMPGTEQCFRMNWASFGIGERRPDAGPEHSIFVGDLAPDVTDYLLQETFRAQYPSVRGAKVVTDPNTGRSKGYGFVKFSDENERNRAMTEMNGVYCSTRPMRISAATPKKSTGIQQQYATPKAAAYQVPTYTTPPVQAFPTDNDITNTTIFVGGLDPNVTEDELKQIFGQFGELVYVKIPMGRGCGFVQFSNRASAEEALQRIHGTVIGQQTVRLSWGRSVANKLDQPGVWGQQADPNQWAGAYYGYGQGYDAYTYGATQDPSLYAYGAYAGYGNYPQQAEGAQDMVSMVGVIPNVEQKEEVFDPLAPPDIDKMNSAYLAVHGSAMVGRPLWLKAMPQQSA
ncbi:polyadenylate-binding protein RBP47B' isoform X2 [Amborella trichopoda]|uniref:polyadenylate-binding protein RBP47B' isoform X2 n=1 Tax=Amborella trichopoda TaxID=13333 RepID=UPI0005D2E952|nr:polyadenylate-binding protein RBP47B' isoform X2 [Amborella trichopoda]|eukprot:XP_011625480.1 polyadenylate-binding protein RBP47B' isoform X2 [Amborella trichopoda]